ncbi:hypothetical protein dqs_0588 [Azoarcus olearius]|uniref:hypothetical protein n=1 Tax=Azoarcus sp. (strain BH72) TaxID=418699 RepID=UPI0008062AA4|nr:hypothetical protein [Azoarcus olearius]ANQ83664.1 hypothetical protein dqs_0588 [Azoarcus olearius]
MPRKPTIELRGGVGPRQRAWDAIRAQSGAEWTSDEIVLATRNGKGLDDVIDARTLQTYLVCLVAAGIVAIVREEPLCGRAKVCRKWYRLVRDEGIDAPRLRRDGSRVTQGLAQEQMWRTLRLLKGDINARELAAHATTQLIAVDEQAAGDYLRNLDKAGYLECTAEGRAIGRGWGKGGTGIQARYRLRPDRNTGPKPPMVCRADVIYDANLQEVVWAPTVTEEDTVHGQ